MGVSDISIRGAREHNLRDVSLVLPRGRLICLTGVSGSGKSSLAFDTLYAEGQRRYVESLSSYARQFLNQLPKPHVDRIDGLAPSIAIQQKTAGRNPRSTVGTITEIHDYLRVLYARVGRQHCPSCGEPVRAMTREQIAARVLEMPAGTPIHVLAPVVRGQKGEYKDLFGELVRAGFMRARVNGQVIALAEPPTLDRNLKHDIEVVIDRLKVDPSASARGRLAEAIEAALKRGDGTIVVAADGTPDLVLSSRFGCVACGIGFEAPSPQLFSFNSPKGMCPACDGLGERHDFDPEKLVPDPSLSVWNGAIEVLGPMKEAGKWRRHLLEGLAAALESDVDGPPKGGLLKGPWADLAPEHRKALLYGTGDRTIVFRWKTRGRAHTHAGPWEGLAAELLAKLREGMGGPLRAQMEPYLRTLPCTECGGARLNARARAVRVGGRSLAELEGWTVSHALEWVAALAEPGLAAGLGADAPEPLDGVSATIAEELLKEIRTRLGFLVDVGLDYLALNRPAPTLSGGEAQRIRLASQVGAGLVGVLYILDEPSIGLHPRDNDRLLGTLQKLRDSGNTVIVVEHDEDTMRAADHLVDFGPGPGVRGGEVVAEGSLDDLADAPASLTGQYLSGARAIAVPAARKGPDGRVVRVVGATHHNLKSMDVSIPLGLLVAVTGVSGSGKSSLVNDILQTALARDLNGAKRDPGRHERIEGVDQLDKMIAIDQDPIGRTPRSNPATYVKLLDEIRDLYTKLPESKARGYKPGRFSFNVPGGRCEACQGNGSNRLEMDFLADVWVTCAVCEGKRFTHETQHIRFKGKSIADVLEMDVQEALVHFENVPKIAAMLRTLHDVGLDYLKLGQPSPSLSGGEAQRIKLARELVRKSTGRTMYVLDEPTTGLHFADVQRLLDVLHRFRDEGNTVVVIEHNLDVIKTADWVIDLGPEGGAGGGRIVAEGTPEAIAKVEASHTGRALARLLAAKTPRKARKAKAKTKGKAARSRSVEAEPPIVIRGAAQHNLKQIDLDLPRHKMTVCSGPSGSGKSSLALDTLYAEGQRRYVESLSSYARQFLAPLQKPKVEHISGLAPAIAIEQKTTSKSPRSTVGTVTEIHDYLRILLARLGQPHCPKCGTPVGTQTADEIVEKLLHHPEGTLLYLLAPIERRDGEDFETLWAELKAGGYNRVRIDGKTATLDDPPKLSARRKHRVEVVVDRATVRRSTRSRLAGSVEAALDLGRGVMLAALADDGQDESKWPVERFSQHRSCEGCGRGFEVLSPHHFSFNSSLGWCPACQGLGLQPGTDPAILIPNPSRSLADGAVVAWPTRGVSPLFDRMIDAFMKSTGIDPATPFEELDAIQRRAVLHGTGPAWHEVKLDNDTNAAPTLSFQFKGLFPALEEASRMSFLHEIIGDGG
jgi:excinuclease ABC subunit A